LMKWSPPPNSASSAIIGDEIFPIKQRRRPP